MSPSPRPAPRGYWCLVLHAHLPYVRHPELAHPLEEDWLFEALTESYVPLLRTLDALARDGVDFRLTLSLSPTLLSMVTDPLLAARYQAHLDHLVEVASREVQRTRREAPALEALAGFYRDELVSVRHVFREEYGSDLMKPLRRHHGDGRLELLTTAATHGLLPLLDAVPQAVKAQVRVGLDTFERCLGVRPRGFWLPECGFLPGHDRVLKEEGVGYSFLEAHGVLEARPRPRAGLDAPVVSPGGVVFFGRDHETSRQVWSSETGYPGDPFYRDFYRDIGWDLPLPSLEGYLRDGMRRNLGIKYHRVTGRVDAADKALYHRGRALARTEVHAAHFLEERGRHAEEAFAALGRPSVVVSPYDAELFGHWWYEGPAFLDRLFRLLDAQDVVRPVTPPEFLEAYPECEVVEPPLSTWGAKGYADVWLNEKNDWMAPHLDMAAERMVELASRPQPRGARSRRALAQAARELLLAQASDWPFLVSRGTSADYAARRFRDHVARFTHLYETLVADRVDEATLAAIEDRDALFPDIDPRVYR